MFDLCGACTVVVVCAFCVSWAIVWGTASRHERETLEIN